jgi:hypothetical protein
MTWRFWALAADTLLAVFLAHQIAFIHHLSVWALLAVFIMVLAILAGADWRARRGRWGAWARTGLTVALFVCLFSLNVASSLTRCDRGHQHCHRVLPF